MKSAVAYVVAAGGIAFANDAIFLPMESGKPPLTEITTSNWRIIPATAVLALLLGGVESVSPEFGAGLGALVLLSVLVIPFGNAGTPLENLARFVGGTKP